MLATLRKIGMRARALNSLSNIEFKEYDLTKELGILKKAILSTRKGMWFGMGNKGRGFLAIILVTVKDKKRL